VKTEVLDKSEFLPDKTASYIRRQQSSQPPLW